MNSDFKDLLLHFNNKNIKYLVVGGYAVIKHGAPRFTGDIDVWIDTEEQNAKRVYQALVDFGAPVSTLTYKDFMAEGFFFQMGIPPNRIDILMSLKDMSFKECFENKVFSKLDIGEVPFISKPDLIKAKKIAARPKDLADVYELEKTMERSESN
jgi:hypothetical protein